MPDKFVTVITALQFYNVRFIFSLFFCTALSTATTCKGKNYSLRKETLIFQHLAFVEHVMIMVLFLSHVRWKECATQVEGDIMHTYQRFEQNRSINDNAHISTF